MPSLDFAAWLETYLGMTYDEFSRLDKHSKNTAKKEYEEYLRNNTITIGRPY